MIGRRFSRHPQSQEHAILGYFTLDRTSIISYELGSGVDVSQLAQEEGEDSARVGQVASHGGDEQTSSPHMLSAVARVQEDMAKVKAMTLLFDERLRAVENLVQASRQQQGDTPSAAKGQKRKR